MEQRSEYTVSSKQYILLQHYRRNIYECSNFKYIPKSLKKWEQIRSTINRTQQKNKEGNRKTKRKRRWRHEEDIDDKDESR